MKICTYISAFALSTLMCCCAGSNKEATTPVKDSVSKDSVSEKFVPVENLNAECYVDKLSRTPFIRKWLDLHGNPFYTNVYRRSGNDGKEPCLVRKTIGRKRKAERSKHRNQAQRTDVPRRLHRSRLELPIRMAYSADGRQHRSSSSISDCIPLICRSLARKHLPFQNHRSAGKPKSNRHRTVRHRPPSDV